MTQNNSSVELIKKTIDFYYPVFFGTPKVDLAIRSQTIEPVLNDILKTDIEQQLQNNVLIAAKHSPDNQVTLNAMHNKLLKWLTYPFNYYITGLELILKFEPLKHMVIQTLLIQYITTYADDIQHRLVVSYFERFYNQPDINSTPEEYLKRTSRLKRLLTGNRTSVGYSSAHRPRTKNGRFVGRPPKQGVANNNLLEDVDYLNKITDEDLEKQLLAKLNEKSAKKK